MLTVHTKHMSTLYMYYIPPRQAVYHWAMVIQEAVSGEESSETKALGLARARPSFECKCLTLHH